jgi:hypothetical protein
MRAVQRLPLPYWLTYLLAFALESFLVHAAAWLDGTFLAWTWQPILLLFPLRTWLVLALMTYLNHEARRALHDFRALLDSDEAAALLEFKLTTLPRRPVWVVILLGGGYFLFLALYRPLEAFVDRPLLTPVYLLSGLGAFGLGSAIYYQTFHQLRIVHGVYADVRAFNLFQLEPVYAFSRLTARTGGAYLLLITLTLLLFPYPVTDLRAVVSYVLQLLLSVLAFLLPLWRTHQRLAAEKRRLQGEVERRLDAALANLHRHLDEFDAQALAGIKLAVESLLLERKVLDEIPTWPWQPGTLKALLTALLLPLVLFLAQLALEGWLRP